MKTWQPVASRFLVSIALLVILLPGETRGLVARAQPILQTTPFPTSALGNVGQSAGQGVLRTARVQQYALRQAADATNLPQTGQTSCYDEVGNRTNCAATGQDGEIRAGVAWGSGRFTDNGDGTVTDELTGLVWLKNLNCAGTIGYGEGYLTWQQALDFVAGINASTYDISSCASYTGNYTDWRLPNVNEIESLNNYESYELRWLAQQGFVNVPPWDDWWSSTSLVEPTTHAYTSNGYASLKLNVRWCLPVRGTTSGPARIWKTGQMTSYATGDDGDLQMGLPWPSPRFTENGDGTVTDELTGLVWLKDANCAGTIGHDPDAEGDGTMRWQQALDFVAGINAGTYDISSCASYTGNYTDWRLPNIREQRSLMDYSRFGPGSALPAGHPFSRVQVFSDKLRYYWTSTTYALMPEIALQEETWYVWISAFSKSSWHWVWPVRGGLLPPSPVPTSTSTPLPTLTPTPAPSITPAPTSTQAPVTTPARQENVHLPIIVR